MADATGTTSWGYDNDSRVTSLDTPEGDVTYGFDNASRRTSMMAPAGTTSYDYDDDSRLTSLENPYSETTSLTYDAASRLTQKTYASGVYDVYGYDSRDRTTTLTHYNSSATVSARRVTRWMPRATSRPRPSGSLTTDYTYDAANQILSESNTGYSADYSYDRMATG